MSDQPLSRQQPPPDDFPPELMMAMQKLWRIRQHIQVKILPREAWIVVALIQFADRNPNLEARHHEMLRWFGGQLIEALVNINPLLQDYLERGWDEKHDVPRQPTQES